MTQTIPNVFANQTGSINLSELDENFTAVQTSLTTEAQVSAASTVNLGSLSSNIALINGAGATISSFGSAATVDQPLYFVRFNGINTLVYNATSLILPGSSNITTAAGDTAVLEFLGSGNWKVLFYQRFDGAAIVQSSGAVAQVVAYETNAVASGTTTIPFDDTIPQKTEGDEYMTLAITPQDASSILIIDVSITLSNGSNNQMTVALFQDTTTDAIAAVPFYITSTSGANVVSFQHKMTAGTTSATTLKVRAGCSGAGTTTVNGIAAGRKYGGVCVSSMTITEVLP